GRQLPPEQRRELQTQFRQEVAKLSPAQRGQLGEGRRQQSRERLKQFFRLSRAEQKKYLDAEIKRMEARRQEMARNGSGPPPGRAGNAGGGPRAATPEQRDQRRRQRLDQTSPEDRALASEYFKQLAERRRQLGLPATSFRGRG